MNLVVLAGGRSRRMGLPKYCLSLAGIPLYEYPLRRLGALYQRHIIVENNGLIPADDKSERLVVSDLVADAGPLGGIYSGLRASDAVLNMVVGADMPFVSPSLAQAMGKRACVQDLDILVPNIDGLLEPLFAIYSSRVANVAAELLALGVRSVRELFNNKSLRIGFIDRVYTMQYDERLMSFFNVNTPDDLIMAHLMMHAGEKSIEEERV
ncbi:MAG TPA: molybdenum cofactor guanylyltransferase [Candidatus Deferrimicrobium sp.]|nr:molybdenum cofactor guanylyltransferase [Candidatus Deferrimicrobium sp.]